MLDLIFSLAGFAPIIKSLRIYELYWSAILRVLGSLFIILIMLDNPSRRISRDPSVEGIVSTAEDVGKIVNRKEEIGDRWGPKGFMLR
jgi:hypothetical protein